jgi:hypothetical protein
MHCTIMFLAHVWLIYLTGHVYAEPELDVPMGQVNLKDFTNLVLTQGKPPCIPPKSLFFVFELYL